MAARRPISAPAAAAAGSDWRVGSPRLIARRRLGLAGQFGWPACWCDCVRRDATESGGRDGRRAERPDGDERDTRPRHGAAGHDPVQGQGAQRASEQLFLQRRVGHLWHG